ncbi:MAG: hypothetical protein PQJ50_10450 [Spirochaetales bacterium]|nr:hypothetical protein [Spirochaetales bacterium]
MPNLKEQLQLVLQSDLQTQSVNSELERFEFEVGFLALEAIIDRVKSFENEPDLIVYFKSLYPDVK